MATVTQRSFSSGELSPSLYGRVDFERYATGARTLRNMMVLRHGGAANRPGTLYVGEVADSLKEVRLIPFIFNNEQTYVMEFGDQYVRFIRNGAYITEAAKSITGITQANPAVVTVVGHGYSNGDEINISGVEGMTEINNLTVKVTVLTANTFEIRDTVGNNINSTGFTAYSSGGITEKIYEVGTPYLESQVGDLSYVQSADVVTIAHPAHSPRNLSRLSDTNWTLSEITFTPGAQSPGGLAVTPGGPGPGTFRYQVTAIDKDTGEESYPGRESAFTNITAVSKAFPAVVTTTGHTLLTNDYILIANCNGMTELNFQIFQITFINANQFSLNGVDSTSYGTYTSGGTVQRAFTVTIGAADPTTTNPHIISWTRLDTALEYNVYKQTKQGVTYGLIGTTNSTSFNDINIIPDTTITPPNTRNPFLGAGNYPSVVTYVQQRLAFASSETVELSRTGNYTNFTTSNPSQDDDAIAFTMAGRQVNEIKAMLDVGKFLIMTSGGEWSAAGDQAGIIRPTDINLRQHTYNGSGDLDPIVINDSVIYLQARGSIIRDLGFDFQIDNYTGNDLTLFSSHLFDGFQIVDWAFQQTPHSILWAVREDGILLGFTYVKEQRVLAWHRHDFDGGLVKNVCVVPEGNEDAVYVTVQRTINGRTTKYVERLNTRMIDEESVEDMIFMDSNLAYDGRSTSGSIALQGGTNWTYDETLTLNASDSGTFKPTDIGNAIHFYDSDGEILVRVEITGYVSGTNATGKAHKTVPVSLRNIPVVGWAKAVDEVQGLWHLEGQTVSVLGDGNVVANPNNPAYVNTLTVSNGTITLDKPYAVIQVGLPFISDVETLDIDRVDGETLMDRKKLVQEVVLYVEKSRGIWAGPKPPSDDSSDPLENLREYKLRNDEGYDDPIALKTEAVDVIIKSEWNSNGRVFIRQVDPLPLTILAITPAGYFGR